VISVHSAVAAASGYNFLRDMAIKPRKPRAVLGEEYSIPALEFLLSTGQGNAD
jgi:hypothetical protein